MLTFQMPTCRGLVATSRNCSQKPTFSHIGQNGPKIKKINFRKTSINTDTDWVKSNFQKYTMV